MFRSRHNRSITLWDQSRSVSFCFFCFCLVTRFCFSLMGTLALLRCFALVGELPYFAPSLWCWKEEEVVAKNKICTHIWWWVRYAFRWSACWCESIMRDTRHSIHPILFSPVCGVKAQYTAWSMLSSVTSRRRIICLSNLFLTSAWGLEHDCELFHWVALEAASAGFQELYSWCLTQE